MRKIFVLQALLIAFIANAQWTNKSFVFGSNTRQYRVYVPAIYNTSNPASLVLTLHGLGDNMTNFSGIGMNYIADTANIIVVVPQAVTDPFAGTAWNSGAGYMGYFPNSTVNDVGFVNALLDTIQSNYTINPHRVYVCGFSMGGFMTERLACELGNRFTAIASVAGTFGNGLGACNPQKYMPVAHFHGTADGTVAYTGNTYGVDADSLVNFWVNYNQCTIPPVQFTFPDIAADNYTVDHYYYSGGLQGSEVEFFKVNGADHVWLGPANDIFYTTEIWKFFNKHQYNPVGLKEEVTQAKVAVFPNPATDKLFIKTDGAGKVKGELFDMTGKLILSKETNEQSFQLNLRPEVNSGVYFVRISEEGKSLVTEKIIVTE